jgi:hypothetical protein
MLGLTQLINFQNVMMMIMTTMIHVFRGVADSILEC